MSELKTQVTDGRLIVKAEGVHVRDASGKWFMDARSGCWNVGLGYGGEEVKKAIREQLAELPGGNILSYDRPAQVTVSYSRALRDFVASPTLRHVRLGNTGSQMTETAVLVSRCARTAGGEPGRMTVLAFHGSYHGLGFGANAFSGSVAGMEFAGPMMGDVQLIDPDGSWSDNVQKKVDELTPERITAVIFEPQMGSLGHIPDAADLRALAGFCHAQGIHLIADEVSTGFGRTGSISRCRDLGIEPDMLVFAKNLTSGYVPLGALLVSDEIYQVIEHDELGRAVPAGSSTDGHPIACAAGHAVLRVYERDNVPERVRRTAYLRDCLSRAFGGTAARIEGAGLMQHVQLVDARGVAWPVEDNFRFASVCEEEGLLLSASPRGVWLVPPLVATEADCDEIEAMAGRALHQMAGAR